MGKKKIIIAIVIVLIAIACYFLFFKKGDEDSKETDKTDSQNSTNSANKTAVTANPSSVGSTVTSSTPVTSAAVLAATVGKKYYLSKSLMPNQGEVIYAEGIDYVKLLKKDKSSAKTKKTVTGSKDTPWVVGTQNKRNTPWVNVGLNKWFNVENEKYKGHLYVRR